MKIYNVVLSILLTETADAEFAEPQTPISSSLPKDSPVKDVAQIFDVMQERGMFPAPTPPRLRRGGRIVAYPAYPGAPSTLEDPDSMTMSHHFTVVAGSFDELQEVLKKFRDVADKYSMPAAT